MNAPTRLLRLHGRHATGKHRYAVVDADLYEYLSHWEWRAKPSASGRVYAVRTTGGSGGGYTMVRLHRLVVGIDLPGVDVFFRDGDTLNCTRRNLRVGPRSETVRNTQPMRMDRKCLRCGSMFATWASHVRPGYCSDACRRAARNEAARRSAAAKRVVQPPVACAWCGTEFAPRRSDARYCSKTCRHRHKNARRSAERNASCPARSCESCGASLEGMRADARFCSRSCLSHARHSSGRRAREAPGPPQRSCARVRGTAVSG